MCSNRSPVPYHHCLINIKGPASTGASKLQTIYPQRKQILLQLINVKVSPYLMIRCRESDSLFRQFIRADIEMSSSPFKHVCVHHIIKATTAGLCRGPPIGIGPILGHTSSFPRALMYQVLTWLMQLGLHS